MRKVSSSFFSPLEAKRLIQLGIPIFIAQLSGMGMSLVDTIMTGQASSVDMAAVAVASSIWNPISLFGVGVLLAISPLCAQLVGEGKEADAPHLMRQGFWVALLLSLVLMLLFYEISTHMGLFKLEERLVELSGGYLRAVLWGLPAFYIFVCIRGFVEGYSLTKPAMVIAILALLLNIPINYILIYGHLGFPAMGAVGCGVATAFCFTFMGISMIIYVCCASKYRHLGRLFRPIFSSSPTAHVLEGSPSLQNVHQRFDKTIIKRIFRIGFPGALAMLFEITLFAASALAIAPLGTIIVAGHQVASSVASALFMIPLSIGITSTIRIGHYLGAGQYIHARYTAWTSLILGFAIAIGSALFMYFSRETIVLLYNDEADVVNLAMTLLIYAASFQIVDGLQMISLGVLRGYNDTRCISIISFIGYWIIGFPLGYILCHTNWIVPAIGAAGFWVGFIVALSFCCACYLKRILHLHKLSPDMVKYKIHQ